ncbi:MAG: NAD(P)H-quinone oxidoreductase [Gammaproteobacteria bacterium]|nr:NAD(P)H-quinone oxidoreductase [Gammaproteobacteria bacterium]
MKYVKVQHGQLHVGTTDNPTPKPNEVLIEIKASGINRADLLQLAGKYPAPAGESSILGLEVAGVVLSAPATGEFEVGDRVMALLAGGGYAQQVCVDVGCVLTIPDNLSFVQGAAIPEAFITAYQCLFEIGQLNSRLNKGAVNVLIHAGASGVGSAAIQLAKSAGARVFTTASSQKKLAALAQLGADDLINYTEVDFCEYIKQQTQGQGVDIVIDFIGASYLTKNISSIALDGTLVSLAMLGGRMGQDFDFAKLLAKRITVSGTTLRNRDYQYKAQLISNFSQQFLSQFDCGKLMPVIDSQYNYSQVALAFAKIQANGNIGKLILSSFD